MPSFVSPTKEIKDTNYNNYYYTPGVALCPKLCLHLFAKDFGISKSNYITP